ncbi:hypothetical protein LQZ21_05670 [Treponema sp. TIM-1]|uniref:hypothetical protein n=1 Tax=Treponema sp. TIM-1 TaxID=2898417 RepID=UPI0039801670
MSIYVPGIIDQGIRFRPPWGANLGSGETGLGKRAFQTIFPPESKRISPQFSFWNVSVAAVSKSAILKPGLLFFILLSLIVLDSCNRGSGDAALIPPPTPPLSRDVLGYGVVNVSYIQVVKEPVPGSESLGYLRRSSLVRVLERKTVDYRGDFESWVLVEGNYRGWLREAMIRIYDNEAQAKTAAESMPL